MVVIILLYACLSASGLIFLKIGAQNHFSMSLIDRVIRVELDRRLLVGFILYIAAFITSLIAMKTTDLNYFYPLSAGLVYILVCFGSYAVLKEHFNIKQIIGIIFILIGVIIMNMKDVPKFHQ